MVLHAPPPNPKATPSIFRGGASYGIIYKVPIFKSFRLRRSILPYFNSKFSKKFTYYSIFRE